MFTLWVSNSNWETPVANTHRHWAYREPLGDQQETPLWVGQAIPDDLGPLWHDSIGIVCPTATPEIYKDQGENDRVWYFQRFSRVFSNNFALLNTINLWRASSD